MKPFKPSRKQLVYFGAIASSIAFVIYCVVSSPEQIGWTGFKEDTEVSKTEKILENGKEITVVTKNVSGKTLWDWLSVLGVPLSLALLGFWFQHISAKQAALEKARTDEQAVLEKARANEQAALEKARANEQAALEKKRFNEQAVLEKEIAESNQKEEVLQAYFDRLSTLLVDKNLIAIASKFEEYGDTSKEEQDLLGASKGVIRARTLSILRRLGGDGERKFSVMQFLIEAGVVSELNLDFSNADLRDAKLSRSILRDAKLNNTNFDDADLSGADLSRAVMSNSYLSNANLSNANLSNAKLDFAILSGASLMSADLSNADLSNAYLIGTYLIGTDLSNTSLAGASLIGADLSNSRNLTSEQVGKAKLCQTKLPRDIQIDPDRDCKELGIRLNITI